MARIEESTNQLLRKKYFVDADAILIRKKTAEVPVTTPACRIIRAPQVRLSDTPQPLASGGKPGDAGQINVHLVKNKDRIEQIHIRCACGRHAELDCRYEAPSATPPAAPRPTPAPNRGTP
jgi:hypothetical protein